ncbi:hypothetical protein Y032_0758g2107 [Ancylostoma ceylanicum]|uniref:Secreted protein n=1 Tax=Ancylostoma ceylanicum TaxID=53326 RepID=A0A016WDI5_9BILA|nr:hypothetical protein Y032_0758g2107 [Ancylostoma ceylanicum]
MLFGCCVVVLVVSRSLALECYSGIKSEHDQWDGDRLSQKSCGNGEICSMQVRVKEDGKTTYILGCTESGGYVGDVGCGVSGTRISL